MLYKSSFETAAQSEMVAALFELYLALMQDFKKGIFKDRKVLLWFTLTLAYLLASLLASLLAYLRKTSSRELILHENLINKKCPKWYKSMFQIFFSGPKSKKWPR